METQQGPLLNGFTDRLEIQGTLSKLAFLDRLRVLFGAELSFKGVIATENKVGNAQGEFVIQPTQLFAPKIYKPR